MSSTLDAVSMSPGSVPTGRSRAAIAIALVLQDPGAGLVPARL
jgi:hypothetical protein